jgi:hypothetical protein
MQRDSPYRSWSARAVRARPEYLGDHLGKLPAVATLHFEEWPEVGDSLDARQKALSTCCRRGGIPLGVVALDQDILCGFALLVTEDFELRPNLSRWLAGVFVRPQHPKREWALRS